MQGDWEETRSPRPESDPTRCSRLLSTEGISSGKPSLDQLTCTSGYSLHLDTFSFSVYHLIIEVASCLPPPPPPLGRINSPVRIPACPSPLDRIHYVTDSVSCFPPPAPTLHLRTALLGQCLLNFVTQRPWLPPTLPSHRPSWANTCGQD